MAVHLSCDWNLSATTSKCVVGVRGIEISGTIKIRTFM